MQNLAKVQGLTLTTRTNTAVMGNS